MEENKIYCVHCREKVSSKAAGTVFRTGYYEVSVRIGICLDCEALLDSKKAIPQMASTVAMMEQPALH